MPLRSENGGVSVGLASVLEADVKQIVTMARETCEKYFFFNIWLLKILLYIKPW